MNAPPNQPPPNQPPRNQGAAPRWSRIVPRHARMPRPPRRIWLFHDQLPGEQVIWIRRRHWIFLLVPAWPLLLVFLAFGLMHIFLPVGVGVAAILNIMLLVATVILLIRWAIVDFGGWLFHYYILTNQRVIRSTGFFRPYRLEAVLKNVVQVAVQRPNPLLIALGLGTVVVTTLGRQGVLNLDGLWRPRDLADSILAIQEAPPGSGAPPSPPAPRVHNPKLQGALEALAAPMPSPPAPPPPRPPFFAFIGRRVPIKFQEGESVVEVVYRHWIILLRNELVPVAILIGGIFLSVFLRGSPTAGNMSTFVFIGAIFFGLLFMALVYLNFVDDIFVLTTHRVIDIDRLIFLLAEYSNDAPYARLQDVHVSVSFIGRILDYGNITVETSGRKTPLNMNQITHAMRVMDHIFGQINLLKERDAVSVINKQRKENHRWLATVLNDVFAEVPDVRGLPLLEAGARIRGAGLKLVVEAERPAPGQRPGTVLEQAPTAGTTAVSDNEVRVVLARSAPSPPATP